MTWLGAVDMGERRILLGAEMRPVICSLLIKQQKTGLKRRAKCV
jgi:hypothetical protein